MINWGADSLLNHTNSPTVVIDAGARRKYASGYRLDMARLAPKGQLSAVVHNRSPDYTRVVGDVLAGKSALFAGPIQPLAK